METIEFFMNFKLDILYWCLGVVTMLVLYELWRRWFVRLWNRRKHRVMEYRYEYKDAVDNRDRYVYPKKESECDCLGVDKLEYNGELPDLYITNENGELKSIKCESKWEISNVELEPQVEPKTVPVDYYMRRGNKRYFRGHNVKVIVTVEE